MDTDHSTERFSEIVGAIYDCSIDPRLWPGVLEQMRAMLGFGNANITLFKLPSGEFMINAITGVEESWLVRMMDYGEAVLAQWGGPEVINTLPLDEPAVLSWVSPRENWENNRYTLEWARPQGLIDVMAIGLARDSTMVGSLGLGRHESNGPISQGDVDLARLFIPHLQRAVMISKLFDIKSVEVATFGLLLDTLAVAVFLVSADMRIVHANAAGQSVLAAGDPARSARGLLTPRTQVAATALKAAVAQAAVNESAIGRRGHGIPAPTADGTPHVLHVLPLKFGTLRPDLAPSAVAAVFVTPARSSQPTSSETLAALFDLTRSEANVLTKLAEGMSAAEVAEALIIDASTVKTHLAHIFAKTGTHRQAELVRLAASLALAV